MNLSVIVDDTNPSIVYTGIWNASFLANVDRTQVFNNTIHGVTGANEGTSLLYNFTGGVKPFINPTMTLLLSDQAFPGNAFILSGWFDSGSMNMNLSFTLDGKPTYCIFIDERPNFFCFAQRLGESEHSLELTVPDLLSSGSAMWVDYIQYSPIGATPTGNDFQLIEPESVELNAYFNQEDDTLQFTFNGNSLICLGCPFDGEGTPESLTFTINGETHPPSQNTNFVFCNFTLDYNFHQVWVNYTAGNLDHNQEICKPRIVPGLNQDPEVMTPSGDASNHPTVSTNAGTPSGTPTPVASLSPEKHRHRTGSIIGGVIGGLVLTVLVILILLRIRRRRRYSQSEANIQKDDEKIIAVIPTTIEDAGDAASEKRARSSMHKSLPSALPQRSSLAKTFFSWDSGFLNTDPQQTAQVGSDYDDTGSTLVPSRRRKSRFSYKSQDMTTLAGG